MIINLYNQSISALALSPNFASDRLCFAAAGQGLLSSHDGGITWQDALASLGLAEPVPIPAVCCAAQPKGGLLVLAGYNGGLLRSADAGLTWQADPLVSPAPVVTALAATRAPERGELYAGTAQDGIFVSQDGGGRWVRWNFGLLDWHIYSLAAARRADTCTSTQVRCRSRVILAGTETGVFFSDNAGRAWRETDFPIDAGSVLALTASEEADLAFAGAENGSLYRSRDAGRTWTRVDPRPARVGEGRFEGEVSALVQSGSKVWAASGSGLWASEDAGGTWNAWNPRVKIEGSILSLALDDSHPAAPRLFAGSSEGMVYILPGGQPGD